MKLRVLTLLLALLVLPALLLQSCSEGQAGPPMSDDGRIVVEFWHAMGRRQGQSLTDIIDLYNKSQTTYKVVGIYQGNYNSLGQKLIASLYAGRNPALSQAYPGWVTRYYRYGFVQPVQHFMESDPDFVAKDLPDFWPVMVKEGTFTHPKTHVKELVTLPFNKSVYVLYVNQTLMEELGFDHPPKTWAEFLELAAAMTEKPEGADKPTRYGFASRPFIEDYTVQLMSAGLEVMDEDTEEPLLDDPAALEALKFLHRIVTGDGGSQTGYVETDYLSNVFGSGRIGMYISSTASFTYNDLSVGNKFIWRAYELPSRNAETEGKTLMQGTNIVIFNDKDEQVQQGAWDFLKFLSSPEMTAMWARETGYMPVRRSALDVPELAAHLEKDLSFLNSIQTLEHATFEPRMVYWESIRQSISRRVESLLLNREKNAEKVLADIISDIEQIADRAR